MPDDTDAPLRRLVAGCPDAVAEIVGSARTSTSAALVVAAWIAGLPCQPNPR